MSQVDTVCQTIQEFLFVSSGRYSLLDRQAYTKACAAWWQQVSDAQLLETGLRMYTETGIAISVRFEIGERVRCYVLGLNAIRGSDWAKPPTTVEELISRLESLIRSIYHDVMSGASKERTDALRMVVFNLRSARSIARRALEIETEDTDADGEFC